jgi:hypothetical protein
MKYDLRKMSDEHLWDLLQRLTIFGCSYREYAKVHDEIMRRRMRNSPPKLLLP